MGKLFGGRRVGEGRRPPRSGRRVPLLLTPPLTVYRLISPDGFAFCLQPGGKTITVLQEHRVGERRQQRPWPRQKLESDGWLQTKADVGGGTTECL